MPRRVLTVDDLIKNLHDYFTMEKNNNGPMLPIQQVQKRVTEALKISETKLQSVLRQEKNENKENAECVKYKQRVSLKSVDVSEAQKWDIRNVIYDMCANKKHITLDTLLSEIQCKHILDTGRSSLCKLLHNIGFKFTKDDNRRALCEKKHVVEMRTRFLRNFAKLSAEGYKFVYLDETWIFSRGGCKRVWHDNDPKSVKNTGGVGKRFIVLHAGSEDGFINDASLVFSSKSKSDDYHDSMNANLFEKWLQEKLLPNLEQPSVIVLDNAPYHSTIVNAQPSSSWKKDDIKNWLKNEEFSYPPDALKSELLRLAQNLRRPKQYKVDTIIREHGHEVLRLPPYHCQFNPIELVWGRCKEHYDKYVGETSHSDNDVIKTWENALKLVTPQIWDKCVKHTNNIIKEWWDRECVIDEINPITFNVNTGDSDSDWDDFDD